MPKPDPAHKETDKILRDMEKRLDEVYKQAYKEARQTADDFMKQFREMDKKKRQQVKDGKLDKAEYERWRRTQIFQGNRYHQMADTLAADMTHTNQIAASVINGYLPEVYAVNHNYGTYEIEKGSRINTQYTMYDRQTVERLMRDNPDLLPRKAAVNVPKDQLWNKKHINSAVTQGILQGEAIDKIAQRLAATVTDMSHTSAMRNARTMTTSAQNGGRIDSYKRAESMGIKILQQWLATLDSRTRHEHRQLDGQKRKVGEPFEVEGEKIFFPGDPTAEPSLVWNCRCTLIGEVEGVDYNLSDVSQRDNKLGDMTYEEWKEEKRKQDNAEPPAPKPETKPKAEDKPAEVEVPAPTVEKPDAVDETIPKKPKAEYNSDIIVKTNEELGEVLENTELTFRGIPRTNPMSDWGHAMFADEGVNAYFPDDIYELEKSDRHAFFVEKNQLTAFDDVKDIIIQTREDDRRKDILSDYGFSEEQMELKKEELLELFNPSDIVDDALGFDSLEFTTWFKERIADEYNIDGIKTNDGAIVFNKNIIHEIVPNPEKKEVKKEESKPKENNNSEAMQEYLEFKSKMEQKYGANLWLDMTDAEMDKLEELERKAHKGR